MNNLLHITNLKKHYHGFSLDGINLTVPEGSIVGLIGSNGAGKTTTIKSILGLVKPNSGSIVMFGEDVTTVSPKRMADLKQNIGVVLDTCSYPEELSVETIGKLMSQCYRDWDSSAFNTFLKAFDLPLEKTVKELSRGMGMKLSLICALSHNPQLLVLDEATAGLDPLAREQALNILRTFMNDENKGILMSSHITSDLEKIADYIVCIDEGRIVFAVEKDAITDRAGVAQCRAAEFDAIVDSGFFTPGTMRFERSAYGTAVFLPDRFAFAGRFDAIVVDRADIDTYLSFMLKGEVR